eukprot:5768169-Prymnesium_polylepis.1
MSLGEVAEQASKALLAPLPCPSTQATEGLGGSDDESSIARAPLVVDVIERAAATANAANADATADAWVGQ